MVEQQSYYPGYSRILLIFLLILFLFDFKY